MSGVVRAHKTCLAIEQVAEGHVRDLGGVRKCAGEKLTFHQLQLSARVRKADVVRESLRIYAVAALQFGNNVRLDLFKGFRGGRYPRPEQIRVQFLCDSAVDLQLISQRSLEIDLLVVVPARVTVDAVLLHDLIVERGTITP